MLCSRTVQKFALLPFSVGLLLSVGCGGEEEPPPPPVLEVRIVDATTGSPVAGAQVLEGRPGTGYQRHQTDAQGVWSGEVSAGLRDLRVEAPGFNSSPAPFTRLTTDVSSTGVTVVGVELEPRPETHPGLLSGRVTLDGAPGAGVLVTAAATINRAGLTDAEGNFMLFDLPPGEYRVEARRRNFRLQSLSAVRVPATDAPLLLELSNDPGFSVTGTTSFSTTPTEVALQHYETGEPLPGATVSTDGGRFTIGGMPAGRYRVRAFLEEDDLVLSPDLIRTLEDLEVVLGDTDPIRVDVPSAPSMALLAPSATSTASVGSDFEFRWRPHEGATFYVVEVENAHGQVVWGGFDARGVPRFRVLGSSDRIRYGAQGSPIESLRPGNLYRFRVYAGLDVTTGEIFRLVAASEELAGQFRVNAE